MASMTGPSEVWFTVPWESNAAWGEANARDAANPKLSAGLERLSAADAEHLISMNVIVAMASMTGPRTQPRRLPGLEHGPLLGCHDIPRPGGTRGPVCGSGRGLQGRCNARGPE
jgi:hypothetical protein